MDREPIELDTFHHVFNRGVDKRVVFLDDADRSLFVGLLALLNNTVTIRPSLSPDLNEELDASEKDPLVSIVAFCLMPNHYHLLLYELTEGGISKFMQRLGTAYTMYFNEKNKRTGALFEGRFKSRYVDDLGYLMHLIDYIHVNPIQHKDEDGERKEPTKEGLRLLDNYTWSSYSYFCGERRHRPVLDHTVLSEYLELPKDYRAWLQEQYDFKDDEFANFYGIDQITPHLQY